MIFLPKKNIKNSCAPGIVWVQLPSTTLCTFGSESVALAVHPHRIGLPMGYRFLNTPVPWATLLHQCSCPKSVYIKHLKMTSSKLRLWKSLAFPMVPIRKWSTFMADVPYTIDHGSFVVWAPGTGSILPQNLPSHSSESGTGRQLSVLNRISWNDWRTVNWTTNQLDDS